MSVKRFRLPGEKAMDGAFALSVIPADQPQNQHTCGQLLGNKGGVTPLLLPESFS